MADNKSSSSVSSRTSLGHTSSSRTPTSPRSRGSRTGSRHGSALSYNAEKSLIRAATRKAELECRASALQKRVIMEKKELELKHQKEVLDMDTELKVEEAKINVLAGSVSIGSESRRSKGTSILDSLPQPKKAEGVRHWLAQSDDRKEEGGVGCVKTDGTLPVDSERVTQYAPLDPWRHRVDLSNTKDSYVNSLFKMDEDRNDGMTMNMMNMKEEVCVKTDRPSPVESERVTQYTPLNPWMHDASLSNVKDRFENSLCKMSNGRSGGMAVDVKEDGFMMKTDPYIDYHDVEIHVEDDEERAVGKKVEVNNGVGNREAAAARVQEESKIAPPHHRFSGGNVNQRNQLRYDRQIDSSQQLDGPLQQYCNQMATMLLQQQQRATLPQRRITPYNGDPLQFCTFMKAFKYGIENKSTDNMEKLYFLEELTTGEPNTLVRGFLNKGEDSAFDEAKAALTKKFGNKYIIAEVFKSKANKWPEVKKDDVKGWTSFSIFLGEYWNTMEDLQYTHEVDHSSTIKCLVSKLPYSIRNLWRVNVDKVMEEQERVAGFKDFLAFVEKQTRIVSNPVYGNILDLDNQNPEKSKGKQPARSLVNKSRASFTTSSSETKDPKSSYCLYCEKDTHPLEVCRILLKKQHADRIKFLKSKGLCYGCLKKGNHLCKDCTKKLQCNTCKGRHPTVLHQEGRNNKDKGNGSSTGAGNMAEITAAKNITSGLAGASNCTLLPVIVRNKTTGVSMKTIAMLDEGSDAVFCSEKLRNQLGASGCKTKLLVKTITGSKYVDSHKIDQLEVMDVNCKNVINLPHVYTCPTIPANTSMPTLEDLKPWPYLNSVDLPECDNREVQILIGNNVPEALEPWEILHSESGGPFACKTLLGWTIHGLVKPGNDISQLESYRVMTKEIEQQLVTMYNHDFTERTIDDEIMPQRSIEDQTFVKLAEESIRKINNNYEVGIPLRDMGQKFPNNRPLAEKRACHLKSKFGRNEEFHKEYTQAISTNIDKGYAEEVPEEELHRDDGKIWYLPHHGVRHPQKHKLRVVFDCAATYKGISLNQRLLQGPDLTNSLVGVLTRFRESDIAITADIESMFNQVTVPYNQRDLLRFLWWSEGDTTQPLTEYRMKTHLFGATSSPSCVNYALRRIADTCDVDKYGESVADCIRKNFYVDDCLKSTQSEEEALSLVSNLRAVLKQGGFNLTKWTSNSRRVLESIPMEERAQGVRNIEFQDALPVERALGVLWSPQTDSFGFQVNLKDHPTTRRGILSVVSSFYDPLGFISPVILPARTIMQDLCKLKLGWDEKIPSEHETKWQQWLREIPRIADFKIPRCFVPSDFGPLNTVQLHHFSDASELGYGTVSYLRFTNQREEVHCSLVTSKSRVAPLKQVTIPRLELTAATVAVKVNYMIQKELDFKVDNTYFWTDSMTVLRYINNEAARYKTFVANRLSIIRDGSDASQWRYVSTSENPADDNSRGQSIDKFLRNKRYHNAPDFLWKDQDQWPVTSLNQNIPLEADPEVKQLVVGATKANEDSGNDDVLEKLIKHYSDWMHLLRAVAWWLRLKQIFLNKVRQSGNLNSLGRRSLTADELMEAEYAIIRHVQKKSFPLEFAVLKQEKDTEVETNNTTPRHIKLKKTSAIANLDPELHDDLLRVGGRLRNAPISMEAKHQLILPKCHPVSRLIIKHTHERVNHQGRNHVMAELRQRYWIVKAGVEVRKLVRRCVTCRKYQAAVGSQKMADLPATRLQPAEPAFTYTGVDYFGPLMIKKGRTAVKRYGVLFTCMTSRAVHLEVANNLDTSSCISAVRRFMARRGPIKELRSDNGTNFVGAKAELKSAFKQINQDQVNNFTSNHGIKWTFNTPASSHHGGVWERQIRTVRKVLQSILQTQFLKTCQSEEQLYTLLCEVEATINSRPLTKVSDDPRDLEVLTPNDLLLLKPNHVGPPGKFSSTDMYARQRWKQMQFLADQFWKRWLREYIPDLQQRQKWLQPKRNLMVGDVVMIADESLPRNTWLMGRVLEVFPDKNGHVRQAHVKTETTTLRRPVTKLVLVLEADLQDSETQENL